MLTLDFEYPFVQQKKGLTNPILKPLIIRERKIGLEPTTFELGIRDTLSVCCSVIHSEKNHLEEHL